MLKQLWIRNDGFRKIRSVRKISGLRGRSDKVPSRVQEEMLPPLRVRGLQTAQRKLVGKAGLARVMGLQMGEDSKYLGMGCGLCVYKSSKHQQGNFQASICLETFSISGGFMMRQQPGASHERKFRCHLKHGGEQNLPCPAQELSLEDGQRLEEKQRERKRSLLGLGCKYLS